MATSTVKAAVAAGFRSEWWAVRIGFDTPLMLTDSGEPLSFDGMLFEPASARVKIETQPFGATARVNVDDDGSIDLIELDEDAPGRTLEVWRVWLTSTGLETEQMWDGVVEDYDASDYGVGISFTARADSMFRAGPATPTMDNRCIWASDFKGPGCGYFGSGMSCDGSTTQCSAYGNLTRFVSAFKAPNGGETITIEGQPFTVTSYPPSPDPAPASPPITNGAAVM
jgi:hypothetical protein